MSVEPGDEIIVKSLLESFRSLDAALKDSLADIDSPLLLSFATLDIAENQAGSTTLTAEHITACLEAAGVAVAKTSVSRALARADNRVSSKKGIDGETHYKLMTKGKREIANLVGGELMSVVRIESGQPRTGRRRLGEELASLKGMIRICDPYYGVRTLDSLDHIRESAKVRFLTARTSEAGRRLRGALRDYKRERSKTEFRVAAVPSELHDRYVLTNDRILILGHGLKDIGGKESFMIRLDRTLVPDLAKEMRVSFDGKWRTGTPL